MPNGRSIDYRPRPDTTPGVRPTPQPRPASANWKNASDSRARNPASRRVTLRRYRRNARYPMTIVVIQHTVIFMLSISLLLRYNYRNIQGLSVIMELDGYIPC